MSTIFVSYRRDDSSGHAGRLYDRLAERFGKNKLFRDIDQINFGDDFVEALEEAVGSCKALIAVIGPSWLSAKDKRGRKRLDNSHDFVRIEIESALARGIPIFPVLVNNAEMPNAEELPESINGVARRQALEISETRFDYDVGQLLDVLESKVGLTAKEEVKPKPPKQKLKLQPGHPGLSIELENEPLPPSVKHKLSEQKESVQLRFLDFYRDQKKSIKMAYLFLILPYPLLGLHNSYLGNRRRQLAFWSVCCLPICCFFIFLALAVNIPPPSEKLMALGYALTHVWPAIDLFLLPSMVRKRNEYIAKEIVFGDPDNYQK